jgi:hypothetical protein
MTPVAVTVDPLPVKVAVSVPVTPYRVSVQVPIHVEVPDRGPKVDGAGAGGDEGPVGVEDDDDLQPATTAPARRPISTNLAPRQMLIDIGNVYLTCASVASFPVVTLRIALVRHGMPVGADNPVVNASGFARWARAYERSRVRGDSIPPADLGAAFDGYLVVSSGLPRAMHSAEMCFGRGPDLTIGDLREMEIPRYRIPLRMPAYAWLFLNRALWFVGVRGRFESVGEARARARRVSSELDRLAEAHGRIVVFGHAMMNRRVAENLLSHGWRGQPRRAGYWGVIDLEKRPA